jgi:hypothetical protein
MAQRDPRGMTTVLAPVFRLERLNLTVPAGLFGAAFEDCKADRSWSQTAGSRRADAHTGSGRSVLEAACSQTAIGSRGIVARAFLPEESTESPAGSGLYPAAPLYHTPRGCSARAPACMGQMAKARTGTKRVASTAAPAHRQRVGGARRAITKPSLLRRVGRVIWVSPRHAALALVTGLVCGSLASRIGGMISPPYAAILGTLVVYPALVAIWPRLSGLRRGGR